MVNIISTNCNVLASLVAKFRRNQSQTLQTGKIHGYSYDDTYLDLKNCESESNRA